MVTTCTYVATSLVQQPSYMYQYNFYIFLYTCVKSIGHCFSCFWAKSLILWMTGVNTQQYYPVLHQSANLWLPWVSELSQHLCFLLLGPWILYDDSCSMYDILHFCHQSILQNLCFFRWLMIVSEFGQWRNSCIIFVHTVHVYFDMIVLFFVFW